MSEHLPDKSPLQTTGRKKDASGAEKESHLLFQMAQAAADANNLVEAVEFLRRAIKSCPGQALYLRALGELLLEQHAFEEALTILQQALSIQPETAETHFSCGIAAENTGQFERALSCYERAVQLDPNWKEAWFNLGILCHRLGNLAKAEQVFQRILAKAPNWAAAYLNLGSVLFKKGEYEQALNIWSKAEALDPHNAQTCYNLGTCFQAMGQGKEAEAAFAKCLSLDPKMVKALLNLGKCYYDRRDFQKAAESYEQALAIDPAYSQAWSNLAVTRLCQEDIKAVVACYQKVVELEPENDAAHLNLAVALRKQERIGEAVIACRRALEITPHFKEARAYLFQIGQHACDWPLILKLTPALDADTRQSLENGSKPGESPMLSLRRHSDEKRHVEVAKAWSHFISLRMNKIQNSSCPSVAADASETTRIRIGYISNDFKEHAVAHQIRGLLAAHERQRFEIFAYACNPPDATPCQASIKKACDHFIPVHDLSDAEAAGRIQHDRIHILIDLMGHTQGNRLPILAHRPAPVQVGYLGFLGSSGADFIDYLITDAVAIPSHRACFYSEKLVFMPNCYQVNDDDFPQAESSFSRPDFGIDKTAVVYCCFNQPYKIDQTVFKAWMAILRQVPQGVLWLLRQSDTAVKNLKNGAAKAGINPERLIFGNALQIKHHLARLLLADLALDPFIYNGGATTSNALWAGVPVICLMGTDFVSRMSASALMAVGLGSLVTQSPDEYVRLAVDLGLHPEKRKLIKQHLQQGRRHFPLFNTNLFARHLESAFQIMWDRYISGRKPETFTVRIEEKDQDSQAI